MNTFDNLSITNFLHSLPIIATGVWFCEYEELWLTKHKVLYQHGFPATSRPTKHQRIELLVLVSHQASLYYCLRVLLLLL